MDEQESYMCRRSSLARLSKNMVVEYFLFSFLFYLL